MNEVSTAVSTLLQDVDPLTTMTPNETKLQDLIQNWASGTKKTDFIEASNRFIGGYGPVQYSQEQSTATKITLAEYQDQFSSLNTTPRRVTKSGRSSLATETTCDDYQRDDFVTDDINPTGYDLIVEQLLQLEGLSLEGMQSSFRM
eukprot:Trichotokara_eunicae@DN2152_c0_g1_i1.p1